MQHPEDSSGSFLSRFVAGYTQEGRSITRSLPLSGEAFKPEWSPRFVDDDPTPRFEVCIGKKVIPVVGVDRIALLRKFLSTSRENPLTFDEAERVMKDKRPDLAKKTPKSLQTETAIALKDIRDLMEKQAGQRVWRVANGTDRSDYRLDTTPDQLFPSTPNHLEYQPLNFYGVPFNDDLVLTKNPDAANILRLLKVTKSDATFGITTIIEQVFSERPYDFDELRKDLVLRAIIGLKAADKLVRSLEMGVFNRGTNKFTADGKYYLGTILAVPEPIPPETLLTQQPVETAPFQPIGLSDADVAIFLRTLIGRHGTVIKGKGEEYVFEVTPHLVSLAQAIAERAKEETTRIAAEGLLKDKSDLVKQFQELSYDNLGSQEWIHLLTTQEPDVRKALILTHLMEKRERRHGFSLWRIAEVAPRTQQTERITEHRLEVEANPKVLDALDVKATDSN